MQISLQMAILSHLSDAQMLMSFEGREARAKQEINFALEALDRYPEMAGQPEETISILQSALELGEKAHEQINEAKRNIMQSSHRLYFNNEELDEIYFARS